MSTPQLAAFSASTEVPEDVIGLIEECLLDLVGHSAFSARFAESSPAFRQAARALDPKGAGCTVIGEPESYSPLQAALLNGAYAHTMDFDDTNVFGVLHCGAPVIPAVIACSESMPASGRTMLEAIAVGYEVASRIGAALGETAYDRGFHVTSVAGIFGAVAAAGRLKGLDAATLESAFGIAGSLAAGSMQYLENGAWNKRLHPGFASHNALLALSFAQSGMSSAKEPLTGRYGLLTGYSAAPKADRLTDGLGERWVALLTGIKPYPSCRLTHGAVDAALELRSRVKPTERDDSRLVIELGQKAFDIVGEALSRKVAPRNIVDAQFSVYFQAACAWAFGKVDWQSYELLGDERLESLMRRMSVSVGAGLQGPAARLSVQGRPELVQEVLVPSGEPATPLGRSRLVQKFMSLAEPVYGRETAARLAERLLSARTEASAAALVGLLRVPA